MAIIILKKIYGPLETEYGNWRTKKKNFGCERLTKDAKIVRFIKA